MGKTANETKQRWNNGRYKQVKVSVAPEIALRFKAVCQADNVSMASELSRLMVARADGGGARRPAAKDPLVTRGGRRKRLGLLIEELERIKDAEERYLEAIPENLKGSIRHESAEQSVSALEDAIGALSDAY